MSVTLQQELQTSGISSKAINQPFNKTLLVFAAFWRERSSYIKFITQKPDKLTVSTRLSDNFLKLE